MNVLDVGIQQRVTFDGSGLVPAIIQDRDTRDVLMLGYMNDVALHRTLTTGRVWFWSRSRQEYWRKEIPRVHSSLCTEWRWTATGMRFSCPLLRRLLRATRVSGVASMRVERFPPSTLTISALTKVTTRRKNRQPVTEGVKNEELRVGSNLARA